jgi:hypothetical protein
MVTLGLPLVIGTYPAIFRPFLLALYAIPFFIIWLFEAKTGQQRTRATIPFILTLLFFPFTHTIIALAIVLLLTLLTLTSYTDKKNAIFTFQEMFTSLTILIILWLSFFSSLYIFPWLIKKLLSTLLFIGSGRSMAGNYLKAAQHAAIPLYKIISIVFFSYGSIILYLIPVFIAIVFTLFQIIHHKRKIDPIPFALSIFSILIGVIAVLSIFVDLITYSPLRYFSIVVMIAPLIILISLNNFTKTKPTSKTGLIIVIFLVSLASSILGIFNTFDSPLTGHPNWQFSYAQRSGNMFLINKAEMNEHTHIYSSISGYRNFDSVLNNKVLTWLLQKKPYWEIQRVPNHFGYDTKQNNIETSSYLFLTAYERAFYLELWPEGGRIEKKDYEILQSDSTWQYIYSSGDFDIWQKSSIR